MKPEPRLIKKRSTQFEPHADPKRHVMMSQRKAKSDLNLGKAQSRLAKRKKVLRTEKAMQESSVEKEERKKKETERKRIWRLKMVARSENVLLLKKLLNNVLISFNFQNGSQEKEDQASHKASGDPM